MKGNATPSTPVRVVIINHKKEDIAISYYKETGITLFYVKDIVWHAFRVEKSSVKHTLKRLQRNIENYSSLLDISNLYNIHSSYEETIKDERVLISVDEGDLVHDYGKSFELISKVRDGSSKKKRINNGYFLNHAVCYSTSSKRVLPLYLLYRFNEKGIKI